MGFEERQTSVAVTFCRNVKCNAEGCLKFLILRVLAKGMCGDSLRSSASIVKRGICMCESHEAQLEHSTRNL